MGRHANTEAGLLDGDQSKVDVSDVEPEIDAESDGQPGEWINGVT
jgi:hypothetical protein